MFITPPYLHSSNVNNIFGSRLDVDHFKVKSRHYLILNKDLSVLSTTLRWNKDVNKALIRLQGNTSSNYL